MGWIFKTAFWGLFTLCSIGSGLLLLPACGLALPYQPSLLQNLRSKYCPVNVDRISYLQATEERKAKLLRIHQAEMAIARVARCTSGSSRSNTSPPPRAQPKG